MCRTQKSSDVFHFAPLTHEALSSMETCKLIISPQLLSIGQNNLITSHQTSSITQRRAQHQDIAVRKRYGFTLPPEGHDSELLPTEGCRTTVQSQSHCHERSPVPYGSPKRSDRPSGKHGGFWQLAARVDAALTV